MRHFKMQFHINLLDESDSISYRFGNMVLILDEILRRDKILLSDKKLLNLFNNIIKIGLI